MLDEKKAPDLGGNGQNILQLTVTTAFKEGERYSVDKPTFSVLVIDGVGHKAVVDSRGQMRFIRRKANQSFGEKQVYTSRKKYKTEIVNVGQPIPPKVLSVILSNFFAAVAAFDALDEVADAELAGQPGA